jgi:dipeptidyl aminopeptidase/acylaminoacyl peptidase
MLLMHGDNDQLVIFNQSELLYAALQKAGVKSHLHKVSKGGHGFGGTDESPEALFARALAFFDKQLK